MITKTFICDVCKKSVGESELFQVTASVTIPKQANYSSQKRANYSSQKIASCDKDICRGCLEKKGLIAEYSSDGKKDEQVAQNQKTFEAKVIDFLEDIGVAFVE